MATRFASATVETTATDAAATPCGEQADRNRPNTQWESFPQPAGWSVDWDFEELDRAPRLNGRNGAIATRGQDPTPASDEA
jgi:hypothetical protein